jgi:HEAT repeat protein
VFVPPADDDDYGGSYKRKSSGGSAGLVLGLIAFVGVLLCGGIIVGAVVWFRPHLEESVAEGTAKEDGATDRKSSARELDFVDFGQKARAGDGRVSLTAAAVDFLTGTEGGRDFKSKEKLLAIKVRIENSSDSRRLEYTGWGTAEPPSGGEGPRLTDENGTSYQLVLFSSGQRVAGQVLKDSIGPRRTLSDLLVFDAPADEAAMLKLELPARNFGGSGKLGFKLPRSAIRFGNQPAESDKSRSIPDLIADLKDSDRNTRLAAANSLGAQGPRAALAAKQLGEMLKEDDPTLRLAAAQALGKIGPTAHEAYPALLRRLGDRDAGVREAARQALDRVGRPTAEDIPELREALKDPTPAVRVFALDALLSMELSPKTAAPLYAAVLKDEDRTLRLRAVKALGKVGPKGREAAFPALLGAMRDVDPEVRKAAGEAIETLGPPAAGDVPSLRALLGEKGAPAELRARVARSLGALGAGASKAVPELAEAVRAPEVEVRRAAAAALAQVGPAAKDALLPLMEALKDRDKEVRRAALLAIGQLGAEGKLAVDDVEALVNDKDPDVRKAAGRVLVQIAPNEVLATYSRALFHTDDSVRLEAAEVLIAMGADAKPSAADLMAAVGREKNPTIRLKMARALTQVKPDTTAPVRPLAELLSSKDAAMRREASELLAAIGTVARDAVPELTQALQDREPAVRRNAVVALGKVGEPAKPAVKPLIRTLKDRELHGPVADALVKIGPDAIPALIEALKDNENRGAVWLGVARTLEKFGSEARDALDALDRAIGNEKDDEVKKAMREVVKEIKKKD